MEISVSGDRGIRLRRENDASLLKEKKYVVNVVGYCNSEGRSCASPSTTFPINSNLFLTDFT